MEIEARREPVKFGSSLENEIIIVTCRIILKSFQTHFLKPSSTKRMWGMGKLPLASELAKAVVTCKIAKIA